MQDLCKSYVLFPISLSNMLQSIKVRQKRVLNIYYWILFTFESKRLTWDTIYSSHLISSHLITVHYCIALHYQHSQTPNATHNTAPELQFYGRLLGKPFTHPGSTARTSSGKPHLWLQTMRLGISHLTYVMIGAQQMTRTTRVDIWALLKLV